MTARTKLTVLDRLHTLLVVLLGSAVAVTVLVAVPKPAGTAAQMVVAGCALASGYGVSFLTDAAFSLAVRRSRTRLLAAIRQSDPQA